MCSQMLLHLLLLAGALAQEQQQRQQQEVWVVTLPRGSEVGGALTAAQLQQIQSHGTHQPPVRLK
jgi:hypothetical protein